MEFIWGMLAGGAIGGGVVVLVISALMAGKRADLYPDHDDRDDDYSRRHR